MIYYGGQYLYYNAKSGGWHEAAGGMMRGVESRNLREMLAEAKDTSELMVDLAYAALFFDDPDMADEVDQLESQISELVHQMRALCIIAVRNPREAEAMIIHELLHTLGLGENPPTSIEITRRVESRCH